MFVYSPGTMHSQTESRATYRPFQKRILARKFKIEETLSYSSRMIVIIVYNYLPRQIMNYLQVMCALKNNNKEF